MCNTHRLRHGFLALVGAALAAEERVTRAERIRALATRAKLDPDHTIGALRRENRIEPLFKGFYLVNRSDEALLHEGASAVKCPRQAALTLG